MSNLVVMEYKWFSGLSCVGVVFAFDRRTDIYHGYIGVGRGFSEDGDVQDILDYGCRLTREETHGMIESEEGKKLIESIPDKRWKK